MNHEDTNSLETITEEITDQEFLSLIKFHEKRYLDERNFHERFRVHRNPPEVIADILNQLNRDILQFQRRPSMQDIDLVQNSNGHVTTKIGEIFSSDRHYRSLLRPIKVYSTSRSKEFHALSIEIAEYRAMWILSLRLQKQRQRLTKRLNSNKIPSRMAKNFDIEKRETYAKPYLKVFLKEGADHAAIQTLLNGLSSVKNANITDQSGGKRDLTIYPQKAYGIDEVEIEVKNALINYFQGSIADPTFKKKEAPLLSDQAYVRILDEILILGKNLESSANLVNKFDEESYRDYFIPHLNSISDQFSAKGEVFHKKGKTDMLIHDKEGNNIFIGECKLWKGEAYLLQGVNQLLERYINWRDDRAAIIVFNQTGKHFSEIIKTATTALANHPSCVRNVGQRKETSFSYLFKHPADENKTIKLELVLLNFA